jgi:hypothetical protein
MNHRGLWRLRRRSLLAQVSVGIALTGLLALAANTALASILLQRHLADRQKTLLIHQAEALASCSAMVSVPRLPAKGNGLTRILEAALAGTPERRALVIDGKGNLRYASAFPAALLHLLLTRLTQYFEHSRSIDRSLLFPGRHHHYRYCQFMCWAQERAGRTDRRDLDR